MNQLRLSGVTAGSTAAVSPPLQPDPVDFLRAPIGPTATASPFLSGRSRVLVVDDDPVNRQLLQSFLEQEHYEFSCAENGDEALALAALHPPDVVLLDVVMPGLNGYEVCRRLRAHPSLHQLHILLLTSLGGREARLCGLDAGADDFLNKPVDLIELRTRLRTIRRLNRFRLLSHERARFEAAVAHFPDGIVLTDTAGKIVHANPAFDRMVGVRRNLLEFFPPPVRARLESELPALESGDSYGPIATTLEHTVPPVRVELTVVRFPADQGEMLQFILRDITERTRLETLLHRSQRIELLGQLAGGIVHDVNNLLTVISSHAGLILMGDARDVKTGAHSIQSSAHRGGALLRGILSFARGADTAVVPTHLETVAHEALQIARQLMGARIRTDFLADPSLPAIPADANQLHQIVLNLCVNARDAMPEGGTLTVRVGRTHLETSAALAVGPDACPGDFLFLAVRDTGTGIAPAVLPRLFDPFFTTKPPDTGTGLGLATVLRLVRTRGGFIGVESELGVGSCFTCYFPVPRSVPPPPCATATSRTTV